MKVSLILAMAENRVIGKGNDLPWRLPNDMKRFKEITFGHAIIMGRKTFESIGRPLPGRRSIVLSRNREFRPAGVEVVGDLDRALELVRGEEEVFILGGASLFAEALPQAERLYLTRVHAEIEGDVFCPPLDEDSWRLIEEEAHAIDERHPHAFTFETYERRVGR